MKVHVGVKSDPIESRYSFDWLFGLMADCGVSRMQLGSFIGLYLVEDGWLRDLRRRAERRGIAIASVFTTHREMSGLFTGEPALERASRLAWERLIRVAALVGAAAAGGSCGSVPRDRPDEKGPGLARCLGHLKELVRLARGAGLAALTVEPMSSLFEPPTTPEELARITGVMDAWHARDVEGTVPVCYCGDISHGLADAERRVVHDNWSLFELEIPHLWEFHFKNTDACFDSTFGFSPEERRRGIVDLARLKGIIDRGAGRFPTPEITGYLEIGGPKVGRDYSDPKLGPVLAESLAAIRAVFG